MTDQIAPSLAVELEQAAWDIANIESQIASRHTASMLSASALLTRAAALARAAEKLAEAQLMNADYDTQFVSCPVCGIFRSMDEDFEHAPDCEWMALRALVSSEGGK